MCSPSIQVDLSLWLGLDGKALILLFPLEVRHQSNSTPATLMGRSQMTYDIDGYVKKSTSPNKNKIKGKVRQVYGSS